MAQTRKPDKREKILDTALHLFVERGYLETRIIDIAEACGMAKGTFYEYFQSKEELFGEVFRTQVLARYETLPAQLAAENSDPMAQLKAFVRFEARLTSYLGNKTNFIDSITQQRNFLQDDPIKSLLHSFLNLRFSLVRSIVESGMEQGLFRRGNPDIATAVFFGSLCFYFAYRYDLFSAESPVSCLPSSQEPIEENAEMSCLNSSSAGFSAEDNEFFSLIFSGLTG